MPPGGQVPRERSTVAPRRFDSREELMKRHCFVLLALTLVFAFASAVSAADDNKVKSSLVVSTEWVAKHLDDDSIVLLQVGDKDEYLAAHIPGAQFVTLADISTT